MVCKCGLELEDHNPCPPLFVIVVMEIVCHNKNKESIIVRVIVVAIVTVIVV